VSSKGEWRGRGKSRASTTGLSPKEFEIMLKYSNKWGAPLGIVNGLLGALALMIVVVICNGALTMLFWNWVVPDLFGVSQISWPQGTLLYMLCDVLFKNSGVGVNKK